MPDIAEMHRILEIIKDESKQPEGTTWNQGYWFRQQEVYQGNEKSVCGTAMCFAGWKVFLDGYTKLAQDPLADTDFVRTFSDYRMVNPNTGKYVTYWGTREYARDRLGLSDEQADLLFDEDNDLEDLENIVLSIESESKVEAALGITP